MFKTLNRSYALIKTNLTPLKAGISSAAFERLPTFKSELSLDKLYPKRESSDINKQVLLPWLSTLN